MTFTDLERALYICRLCGGEGLKFRFSLPQLDPTLTKATVVILVMDKLKIPFNPGGLGDLGEDFTKRSYFASTLDVSQRVNSTKPHGIKTIVQLLEEREKLVPKQPAIAMAVPGADLDGEWGSICFCEYILC